MSDTDTPPRMEHEAFRTALGRLGLNQRDFARLLHHLSGKPADAVAINRWATGKRPVPTSTIAILALLEMLPETTLRKLVKKAGASGHS